MIEVFDDRVEISNPGGIPSELDPADFGKKSVAGKNGRRLGCTRKRG
jgi:predicted HTH transcriptional regulator